MSGAIQLATSWDELVTTGLLGTDRREPPALAAGPVADVVDDSLAPTPAARLLTAVAATVVARRAGLTPAPPRPLLAPAGTDPRPVLPPAAARRWTAIVADWPVLEPEWRTVAEAAGWRLPPDILVAMLRRVPGAGRDAVERLGGPLTSWLVDHLPELAPVRTSSGRDRTAPAEAPTVPPELGAAFDSDPAAFATAMVTGLGDGSYRWAHKAVLLDTIASMPPAFLAATLEALEAGRRGHEELVATGAQPPVPLGLWESLIELAIVRHTMLLELERFDV